MMDCTEYERLYDDATAGRLTPDQAVAFAEHAVSCKNCAAFKRTDSYYRMRVQTAGFEPNVPELDWNAIRNAKPRGSAKRFNLPLRTLSLAAGLALGAFVVGSLLDRRAGETAGSLANQTNPVRDTVKIAVPQLAGNTNDSNKARTDSILRAQRKVQQLPEQIDQQSMQAVSGK